MAGLIDHRTGQYRAELFEELIGYLLESVFPGSVIRPNFILPREWLGPGEPSLSIDFFIRTEFGGAVLVETKAPYSDRPSFGINKVVRSLKDLVTRWPVAVPIEAVILAVAADVPDKSQYEVQQGAEFFASRGTKFEVWDAPRVGELLLKFFHVKPATFSAEHIAQILSTVRETAELRRRSQQLAAPVEAPPPLAPDITEGERENVVVLLADFCSFSRFVHASAGDKDLIASVMRRFYRETRLSVERAGGIVDKYMGDGMLAFWMPNSAAPMELARRVDSCVYDLIGISLGVAKEWQDQVDLLVQPTGMRCGAALGKVLFISENQDGKPPIHAIAESINLAARLQAAADPNSFVIANRLKKAYFAEDEDFVELDHLEAKNIGQVRAWKKDYETESVHIAAAAT